MNKYRALLLSLTLLPLVAFSVDTSGEPTEYITQVAQQGTAQPDGSVVLEANKTISTAPKTFKPPVEIIIEAKTDLNSLRIGYAADQVIFNWENNKRELRIDGGPAGGKHKPGMGSIPPKKFVTIRWVVTARRQAIYVDGQLRLSDDGDYSEINNPVKIISVNAKITVKSIKVKELKTAAQ
ncbi:MAG: hypothetical protein P4L99_05825 [Chthoniobacter sp.]|nr:hypothetical protein [Chthoniobacter sp.]